MRPIWRGHLTFGLVTIPVKLYTATDPKDIRFRLLHKSCLTPIQNKRFCPHHDQIVEWNDVVRGYEYEKGKFVSLTEEDLESVPLETAGTVSVTSFVTLDEINPLFYEKSYYLAPDEGGQKAFRLLHDTMT
ncbi:MAG: Ku protein, partial [Acidimicrobiia bacterium]